MSKKEKKEVVAKGEDAEELAKPLPPEIVSANECLEEAIIDLVMKEPFYANLITNMRREFSLTCPTAGVSVTDQVNLIVNPYWFASMTLLERIDVLKHECHHVLNNHFVRFRDLEPKIFDPKKEITLRERIEMQHKMSDTNKAADLAINEYLPSFPKTLNFFDKDGKRMLIPTEIKDPKTGNMIPNPDKNAGKPMTGQTIVLSEMKKLEPQIFKSAQGGQTLEYYYEFYKQKRDEDKKNGQGMDQFIVMDDHSMWHESGTPDDTITDIVKEVVNKAVEQTGDRNMGKMPGEVMQAIEALNHVPKDWRSDIQRFAARSAEIKVDSSRKKRNRRYGILYPGIVTYPKLHLVTALDTSGSVCDESLQQFHAELVRLHNMGIMLTIINCDTKVGNVHTFDPKKPFKVHGRGGTSFKPVFDHIEKEKMDCDGLIYFTDGECCDEGIKKPNYPVLWALTPPFRLSGPSFGAQTKVEIKKRVNR